MTEIEKDPGKWRDTIFYGVEDNMFSCHSLHMDGQTYTNPSQDLEKPFAEIN